MGIYGWVISSFELNTLTELHRTVTDEWKQKDSEKPEYTMLVLH